VGPKAIPVKKMHVENLATAIQTAMTDQEMREKAKRLGKKIQAEDGLAKAIEILVQKF
jgi:UDP:flavonoid glycosyltransferase YjiC (YdhE family)